MVRVGHAIEAPGLGQSRLLPPNCGAGHFVPISCHSHEVTVKDDDDP